MYPTMNIITAITTTIILKYLLSSFIFFCSGVSSPSCADIALAILPSSVFIAVAVTIASALP
ncbi:hypothetical protein D3C73_1674790 [compost metagenome]